MSDNSNPQGTGTAELSDADLDAYLDDDTGDGATDEGEADLEAADADAEPQEGEGEGDPEAEGEPGEQDAKADPVVKLDDGTELKLSELAAGYQRQEDYTRKTQALAAKAKDFDAHAAQFSEQARQREQQLEQAFEDVVALLAARMPKEPDLLLAYTDPATYNQQLAIFNASVKEIQGVMAAQKQTRAKLDEANGQDKQRWYEGEMRKVTEAFPIAADPVKGKQFWTSALETGRALGFNDQELAEADSRQVIALAKLAQYEAREKAKTGGASPKAVVVGQPKRAPAPVVRQPVKQAAPASKALRSFRETRSVNDAERAFAAMDL
jgi:hypothetical protein